MVFLGLVFVFSDVTFSGTVTLLLKSILFGKKFFIAINFFCEPGLKTLY